MLYPVRENSENKTKVKTVVVNISEIPAYKF